METIIFIFVSQKSLQEYQNLINDIMYSGYGFKIHSCLCKDVDFNKLNNDLPIFTETEFPISNKFIKFEGLTAKDLIYEIKECIVLD